MDLGLIGSLHMESYPSQVDIQMYLELKAHKMYIKYCVHISETVPIHNFSFFSYQTISLRKEGMRYGHHP